MFNNQPLAIDDVDLALLLQKTDRILSEKEKISIKELQTNDIACADEKNLQIHLNFVRLKRLIQGNENYLILSKGINYHELAHILFTDYSTKKIQNFLLKADLKLGLSVNGFHHYLNLLEDCRIENLFYTDYYKAKYYFSFCVLKIILSGNIKEYDTSAKAKTYFTLYGRKFLDKEIKTEVKGIRNQLDNTFAEKGEKLVDKYILEPDLKKRLQIAYDFAMLFINDGKQMSNDGLSSDLSLTQEKSAGKSGKTKKLTEDLKEKIKEEKKEEKEDKQESPKKKSLKDTIKDALEKVNEEIENNQSIQKEIEKEVEFLTAGRGEFEDFSGEKLNITANMKLEITKIEKILKELRGDLSTQIFRFQKRGKIDIISIIKSQKNSTLNIFKKKRLNKVDKSRLGVSFLLDTSGSIRADDFEQEIKATYSLCKALKNGDSKAEVLEFSEDFKVLKAFRGEGDWQRHFRGGTQISEALIQGTKDLLKLRRDESINNLFIIIVTDGGFDDYNRALDEIKRTQEKGIGVLWIYSGYRNENSELSKKVDWFVQIHSLEELAPKLKLIIKEIQRKIVKKIKTQGGFYN